VRNNLTKKDIVNSIYMQLGFSKKISELILEDFILLIIDNLNESKKIKISNFGTFFIKKKKSRIGRNPKTNEKKMISERNVVTFKPSKFIKNYINNNE